MATKMTIPQSCRLARGGFQHRPLRDAYEYHIRVRDEGVTIHPEYFIVVDQLDWNPYGELMACLNFSTDIKNSNG